jgi:hypothetical protein
MEKPGIFTTGFSNVYPFYVQKAETKEFDLSASTQEFDIKTKQTHEMCTYMV